MAISNSFHSSTKNHSIANSSKLADVQSHNSRGYFSWEYDMSKIHDLIGSADTISADVRSFIDRQFKPVVDSYNEKQKRSDRKIYESPFSHFEANKKLDVAVEAIFQIGDKDFWSTWRQDQIIQRNGKERVIKSFPDEVKRVMDEIYKKQMAAYEQIYSTHSDVILQKIQAAHSSAQDILKEFDEDETKKFAKICRIKEVKDRNKKINALSDLEKTAYERFADAWFTVQSIDEQKLVSRIQNKQMHIKIIAGTGHYDEWSAHAHGVSVVWADGYKTGLQSRVAKSVVLNRYTLEVLQDRMHEIAKEEMEKHPEIFQNQDLKQKERGRLLQYTKEEYIRKKQEELLRENAQLRSEKDLLETSLREKEKKNDELKKEIEKLDKNADLLEGQIKDLERVNQNLKIRNAEKTGEIQKKEKIIDNQVQIIASYDREIDEQEEALQLISTYSEYQQEAEDVDQHMDLLEKAAEDLPGATRMFKEREANRWMQHMRQILKDLRKMIDVCIHRLVIFERTHNIPDPERLSEPAQARAASLDELIGNANSRLDERRPENRSSERTSERIFEK